MLILKILSLAGLAFSVIVLLRIIFRTTYARHPAVFLCIRSGILTVLAFLAGLTVFQVALALLIITGFVNASYLSIVFFKMADPSTGWNPVPDFIFCVLWIILLILSLLW